MPVTEVKNNFSQFKINTVAQKPTESKAEEQTTPTAAAEIKKDSFEKSNIGQIATAVGLPLLMVAFMGSINTGLAKNIFTSVKGILGLAMNAVVGFLVGKLIDKRIEKGREEHTSGQKTFMGATGAILGGGILGAVFANNINLRMLLHNDIGAPAKNVGKSFIKSLSIGSAIGAATLGVAYFGIKALLKNSANKASETKAA